MIAVKTEGLTKKYKDLTAVDGLNLEIQKGEIYALLGVNGAGKTTAVKMLSCLLQPTGGEAFLCGKSILKDREEVKRIVGVSPQETAVAPNICRTKASDFPPRSDWAQPPSPAVKPQRFS